MEALQYFGGGNVLKYCIAKKISGIKNRLCFLHGKIIFFFLILKQNMTWNESGIRNALHTSFPTHTHM